jgi:hypothetical protein
MTTIKILNQLQDSNDNPNMMTLFNSNTMFRSMMTLGNLPEMLFYRIKQCQAIQRIGKIPYSNDQIIATDICILVQLNISPLKEFDMWEAMATNVSGPQDVHTRGVWTATGRNRALQHIGAEQVQP